MFLGLAPACLRSRSCIFWGLLPAFSRTCSCKLLGLPPTISRIGSTPISWNGSNRLSSPVPVLHFLGLVPSGSWVCARVLDFWLFLHARTPFNHSRSPPRPCMRGLPQHLRFRFQGPRPLRGGCPGYRPRRCRRLANTGTTSCTNHRSC